MSQVLEADELGKHQHAHPLASATGTPKRRKLFCNFSEERLIFFTAQAIADVFVRALSDQENARFK